MKLKPCPFCGAEAEVEREGTSRRSCIVRCIECHCTLESNENGFGHDWNQRATFPEDLVRVNEPPRSGFAEAHRVKGVLEHCSTCSSPKGRGLVCTGAVCGGQVCLHQHVPCPTCSADFPNDSERSKAQRKGD